MGLLKVTRFRRQRLQAAMPARSSGRQRHLGRAAACRPRPPAALALGASHSAPPPLTTTGDIDRAVALVVAATLRTHCL